jgi:hypothetical protein
MIVIEKRLYHAPIVEVVHLDNEISLSMQSLPADPEGWGAKLENVHTSPFKQPLA